MTGLASSFETSRRQRWIKLGLESAAVLLSILTAFAIDAGWDHHTARQDEQAALARLLDEFEANQEELEAVRAGHQILHDNGVQLLRVAYGLSEPSEESPEQLRRVLGMSIYFDPSMGALNRFLASDETGNVAGPELLDRLAGYPAKVDELWQQERMLREMIAELIDPFVVRSADRLVLLPPATSSEDLQSLRTQVPRQIDSDMLMSLLAQPEVRNLITTRVIHEAQSLMKYEVVATEFDAILTELRRIEGSG